MLAQTIDQKTLVRRLEDDAWAASEKIDGMRLLAVVDNGHVTAYGRDGQVINPPTAVMVTITRALPSNQFILDGELLRQEGRYVVFDLVRAGDLISRETPFAKRYETLRHLAKLCEWGSRSTLSLLPLTTDPYEKVRLVKELATSGAEGVILRRLTGQYSPGARSSDVCKHKFFRDVDCLVVAAGEDGRNNFTLGLYDNGKVVEVGKVTALAGDGPKITVGSVVTVKYLRFTKDGRLREPTLPRLRTDKRPEECLMDQVR
jgi:ATP-dependent DNA ligase